MTRRPGATTRARRKQARPSRATPAPEEVVAPEARKHHVLDGAGRTDEFEHPPERPGVVLGTSGVAPFVESSVAVSLVMVEPELGNETREPHEEWRVQDALTQEERVPASS